MQSEILITGNEMPLHEKILSVYGMPEVEIGEKLKDIHQLFSTITLNIFPEISRIQIILSLQGNDLKILHNATTEIKKRLGGVIFSEKNQPMEEVVGQLLVEKKATLSIAESCTGGLIASKITDVPGSSAYFNGGIISYSNVIKHTVLHVSNDTLKKFGAVSEEVVKEMATNMRKIAKTTYALAVSGIAGPDGGSTEKPVGTVKIGLATPKETISFSDYFYSGDRLSKKLAFTIKAIDILRRELLNLP